MSQHWSTFWTGTRRVLSALLVFAAPMAFGWHHQPSEMAIATATGCLAAVFLNLGDFATFKGAGFEATLRAKMVEASATIDQLRNAVRPLMIIALNQAIWGNRHGGMANPEQHVERLEKLAKEFSLAGDPEFVRGCATHFRMRIQDLLNSFTMHLHNIKRADDAAKAIQALVQRDAGIFPDEAAITAKLQQHSVALDSETDQLLREYVSFYEKFHGRVKAGID